MSFELPANDEFDLIEFIESGKVDRGSPFLSDEIMPPTQAETSLLTKIFERLARKARVETADCLNCLFGSEVDYLHPKLGLLKLRIWLISELFKTVHGIDHEDPFFPSYPISFKNLLRDNPDLHSEFPSLNSSSKI